MCFDQSLTWTTKFAHLYIHIICTSFTLRCDDETTQQTTIAKWIRQLLHGWQTLICKIFIERKKMFFALLLPISLLNNCFVVVVAMIKHRPNRKVFSCSVALPLVRSYRATNYYHLPCLSHEIKEPLAYIEYTTIAFLRACTLYRHGEPHTRKKKHFFRWWCLLKYMLSFFFAPSLDFLFSCSL